MTAWPRAVPAIAANDVQREALLAVERRVVAGPGPMAPMLISGTDTILPPTGTLRSLRSVLGAELEGEVLDRVAVVVDVDLVDGVRVEREVVRAAVGPAAAGSSRSA